MEQYHGGADERFGAVADVFARNFAEFPELGAAVTVFVEGRKVVDLWGGVADERTGRAWEQDTIVPVFSVAKALVGVSAHLLAQEGRLDLDAPVSRYWPEFAQHGKETITTRMVLGHRAGVPALDPVLSFEEIAGWSPVIRAIEEQKPLWEPGTAYEYHGHVLGFLVGEVIRRITGLPRARTSAVRSVTRSGCGPGSACPPTSRDAWPGSPRPRGAPVCPGPSICSRAS